MACLLPIVPVIFGSAPGRLFRPWFLCGTARLMIAAARGADVLSMSRLAACTLATWQTRFWCFGFLQLNFADSVARFRRKKPGRSRCVGSSSSSSCRRGGAAGTLRRHHKRCHDGSEKAEDTTPNPLLLHALLFGTNTYCNSHNDDGATIATTSWLRFRFDHHNFQHARIRP